ncbi:MAG: hypothetical protein KKF46_08135 [Nanoarchaeota archaeon]|nr:hypothetical protein [Nanoarchaeota archaeon]MBU1322297.1 hypothetical protein [Nanoarchaeota archaeon]MBU1597836.1 hypothetical protein [Nanoarchaeota archaeon]MBU2441089.1 hypothetical protein [Nanoarchaeota archaeon]
MNNRTIKRKINRKAQLEMIGLIVIVIIVVVALLIFTVYQVTNPQRNIKRKYMNEEIATNMLVSMMNIDLRECHNLSLQELVGDCAKTFHSITCLDSTSCEIANKTIYDILNRTLIDWDVSFNLSVQNTDISFVNLGCTARVKSKIRGFQILPLYPGQIEMILDVCTI